MDKDFLGRVGLSHYSKEEFEPKNIVLRGGQKAILWVHMISGHGILDPKFWVGGDYYQKNYRSEYSSESVGSHVSPKELNNIYCGLNEKQ